MRFALNHITTPTLSVEDFFALARRLGITEVEIRTIVAQIHGYVADMEAIGAIAREHNLTVIGDSSQAHGSTVDGSRSAPFGDIGAMSLMSGKHMVAGGQGGMVATDDEAVYWAAKRFADRGKPFGQTATTNTGLGLNYRMHELEAAMGRVQLHKLDADRGAPRGPRCAAIHDGIAGLAAVRPVRALPGVEINPWSAMFYVDVDQLTVSNTQVRGGDGRGGHPRVGGLPQRDRLRPRVLAQPQDVRDVGLAVRLRPARPARRVARLPAPGRRARSPGR